MSDTCWVKMCPSLDRGVRPVKVLLINNSGYGQYGGSNVTITLRTKSGLCGRCAKLVGARPSVEDMLSSDFTAKYIKFVQCVCRELVHYAEELAASTGNSIIMDHWPSVAVVLWQYVDKLAIGFFGVGKFEQALAWWTFAKLPFQKALLDGGWAAVDPIRKAWCESQLNIWDGRAEQLKLKVRTCTLQRPVEAGLNLDSTIAQHSFNVDAGTVGETTLLTASGAAKERAVHTDVIGAALRSDNSDDVQEMPARNKCVEQQIQVSKVNKTGGRWLGQCRFNRSRKGQPWQAIVQCRMSRSSLGQFATKKACQSKIDVVISKLKSGELTSTDIGAISIETQIIGSLDDCHGIEATNASTATATKLANPESYFTIVGRVEEQEQDLLHKPKRKRVDSTAAVAESGNGSRMRSKSA